VARAGGGPPLTLMLYLSILTPPGPAPLGQVGGMAPHPPRLAAPGRLARPVATSNGSVWRRAYLIEWDELPPDLRRRWLMLVGVGHRWLTFGGLETA